MISCVCPTTASRWWCLPLAIECWRRQTYQDSELVIVVDGGPYTPADPLDPHGAREHIENLIPDDPHIRYVYLQGTRTLGEKYNACIELAGRPWVALWADDDWHAPTRLEATAACIARGADVVGDWTMIVHDLADGITRRYVTPMPDPPIYVISGTMAFRRVLGREARFPIQRRGSDDTFVHRLLVERRARLVRLVQPPYQYVAFCHGQNVTNKRLPREDPLWQETGEGAETILGDDLAKYEAAYLLRST